MCLPGPKASDKSSSKSPVNKQPQMALVGCRHRGFSTEQEIIKHEMS